MTVAGGAEVYFCAFFPFYGQQFQIRKLYGAKALLSKGLTFLDKTSDR
jgi:hypothetical protein